MAKLFIQQRLQEIPVDSPDAEAVLILEYLFNLPFSQLHNIDYNSLTSKQLEQLNDILNRRKNREPIQYILCKAYFFDLELTVNKNVLIPRPETEIMVENIIENLPLNGKFLDVGTGSGAIALCVAKHRTDVEVTAIDISPEALATAKLNAGNHQLKNIRFIPGNLLENLPEMMKFDFIGANLPYVSFAEYEKCQAEVKNFEPQLALTSEDDGLFLIKKCAKSAKKALKSGGKIQFEIGFSQGERLKNFLESLSYKKVKIIKDYNQLDRFVTAEN